MHPLIKLNSRSLNELLSALPLTVKVSPLSNLQYDLQIHVKLCNLCETYKL